MRARTPLLLLAGLLLLTGGASCTAPFKAEARVEQTIAHLPHSSLLVESKNGSITVRVGENDRQEVTVVARMQAGGRTLAQAEQRLRDAELHLNRLGDNTLRIYAQWPEPRFGNDSCSFEITLPDVHGVVARASNGAVSIRGSGGLADVRTSNGNITLAGHAGDATLHTSNGRVIATDVAGRCEARSTNGRIELREMRVEVVASTTNGAVVLELAEAALESFRVSTTNGAIRVRLSAEWAGRVDAHTSNGSIVFNGRGQVLQRSRGRLSASVGEEGDSVGTLRTSNGRITIEVGQ